MGRTKQNMSEAISLWEKMLQDSYCYDHTINFVHNPFSFSSLFVLYKLQNSFLALLTFFLPPTPHICSSTWNSSLPIESDRIQALYQMNSKIIFLTLQCYLVVAILPFCRGSRFRAFAAHLDRLHEKSLLRKVVPMIFNSRQYSFEDCITSANCESPRECYTFENAGDACFSPEFSRCLKSSDCLDNDRCLIRGGSSKGMCISCNIDPDVIDRQAVDGGNCVCVAIESLKQFDRSSLVFDTDRRASVLCDQHENCATSGHIVVYKSKAMSMATYCLQLPISCHRTVKLVNSPKMKVGLRFSSFSKDLKFTALAAAKETQLEEFILKWAVFAGI